MEIPYGKLPSSVEPEIGLNGIFAGGSPEWVSRQKTLVLAQFLGHNTLNLLRGNRGSGFDLPTKKEKYKCFFSPEHILILTHRNSAY